MLVLARLNEVPLKEFTTLLSGIYEHSPWIAEEAGQKRPFKSIEQLRVALKATVDEASYEDKLTLIRMHPELGTKKPLTAHSAQEQREAGLNELTESEINQFLELNSDYSKKFGFPFVKAVKGKTKREIYESLQLRIKQKEDKEFIQAINEIHQIAAIRLNEWFANKALC
ncbi:2-oxo-4-hydroxy-4-carboxy-5-ureidoimidazoline decarboxylase [Shouchella patagoniensis]|uniref:2-oxo-4-hydroxy-4-carboxy-5-ureidoimidazoline decarboxylase n=1 Tax=Shouchella patagoniensis TaxID=228576 RepID=UPI0011164592|nr:2-oxo-4-hydroxy-4-carboxy-5-ureidoimidazoline decarboxylase [Shouchella patagoniensis]